MIVYNCYLQHYSNLVAIVAEENKLLVESAIEDLFLMVKSAINRWREAHGWILKFDPKTDDVVSKYVHALELYTR